MNLDNHDDYDSQRVLNWFNSHTQQDVFNALIEIAELNPQLDNYIHKYLTISEYNSICESDHKSARIFVLVGIILGLINPFLAQAPIGKEIKQKAMAVIALTGISLGDYNLKIIEVSGVNFNSLFHKII